MNTPLPTTSGNSSNTTPDNMSQGDTIASLTDSYHELIKRAFSIGTYEKTVDQTI